MPETKLKPCPFCGKEPITKVKVCSGTYASEIRYSVECKYCDVSIGAYITTCDSFNNAQSAMNRAIEDWNRRTDNSEVR